MQLRCWQCGTDFRGVTAAEQAELNAWLAIVKRLRAEQGIGLTEALKRADKFGMIRKATGLPADVEVTGDTRLRAESRRGPMFRCPCCGARTRGGEVAPPA